MEIIVFWCVDVIVDLVVMPSYYTHIHIPTCVPTCNSHATHMSLTCCDVAVSILVVIIRVITALGSMPWRLFGNPLHKIETPN